MTGGKGVARVVSQNFELHGGEGKGSDTGLGIGIIQLCQLVHYNCASLASANASQIWELPFFRGGKQVVECLEETKLPVSHSLIGSLDSIPCFTTNCGLCHMQFVTN